jgi:hypothetical protein
LTDSLQRPDNVRLFNSLKDLLLTRQTSKRGCQLQRLTLVEPNVMAPEYRRWCYKKTNFLHHVYKTCLDLDIQVFIEGTLILESTTMPASGSSVVSSWLSILQQLPQDQDITSLKITYRDTPSTACTLPPASQQDTRRPSIVDLQLEPVQQLFHALIELFNGDTRSWKVVQVLVLYTKVPSYAAPQTESLLEVAELFDIPLKVQWQPQCPTKRSQGRGTWTRMTTRAQAGQDDHRPPYDKVDLDDTTDSSTVYNGSSGQLCLAGAVPRGGV